MMSIELLLSRADDLCPVLEDGLPADASASAPHTAQKVSIEDFRHDGGDPNSLAEQRWGIVVPEGPRGDRLLALIDPLRKVREIQQGEPALVFRAPSEMSPEDAASWWSDVYCSETIDEADRPRYLAMLGDAHELSWDLQQRLASDAFVGRICCPDEEGYEAYVDKVLRWERKPPRAGCRALFHTVRDGTKATNMGYSGLMAPAIEQSRLGSTKGTFKAREIVEIGDGERVSADDFVAATAVESPAMLFSISHGVGAPRNGYSSPEAQRRLQGAMSFHGTVLDADALATRPFLPGGLWFYFACFGAGTPHASAYHQWLGALREVGLYGGKVDAVLKALPRESQSFVAALPKALLANPEGPLAIMGHVDLAWTFSFHDGTSARPSRFQDIFRTIVDGKRVGAAYFELQRLFNQASVDLSTMYDSDMRAKVRGSADNVDIARKTRRASLWMLRQDLSAYVLLGDPAANLNITRPETRTTLNAPRIIAEEVQAHHAGVRLEVPPGPPLPMKLDPRLFEAALFDPPMSDLLDVFAARWGITRTELDRLVAAYREAGRTAVTSEILRLHRGRSGREPR